MPEVQPFRGVRFNSEQQANLGRVIAPPYDTVDPSLIPSLVSIAALENVNLGNGVDSHATAARRYRDWRATEVLTSDAEPALYVHDQTFVADGEPRERRGLLARVRLAPWTDRLILPHERVFPGPRDEREARLRAVGANLSPLYLLYRDPGALVRTAIAAALDGLVPVAQGIDARAGRHTLFAITNPGQIQLIARRLAPMPFFVADGHHRYEAALAYRAERLRHGPLSDDDPANFVLALLAPIGDPGVVVRPTHRVIARVPAPAWAGFRDALATLFDVVEGEPSGDGRTPICTLVLGEGGGTLTVYPRVERPEQALLPAARGRVWRELDVAVGDHVILGELLGIDPAGPDSGVRFTPDEGEARAAVATGAAKMAILYAPPALEQLVAVAAAGDLLPPKSTFFDPKPPAGLVISDHGLG